MPYSLDLRYCITSVPEYQGATVVAFLKLFVNQMDFVASGYLVL